MNPETKIFFATLFKDTPGNIELRALPSQARVFTRKVKEVAAFCDQHQGEDLYFGVATRRKGSSGGKKEDCHYLPGLWVDIDFKDGIGEAEADKIIVEGPLQPSVMVYSGNGVHLYWLFKESEQANKKYEPALRRLASYYKGDMAVADLARILRIPGTINHKYSPPRPVNVVVFNENRYDFEDFEIYGDLEEKRNKNEEGWDDELLKGVSEGGRDDSATKLAGKWFGLGLSRQEVIDALTGWNLRNNPPLEDDQLTKVADSIGRRHGQDPEKVLDSLPGISLGEVTHALHALRHITENGLKSGLEDLDKAVGGVWRDGIVISGDPGDGKSILSLNLGVRFALQGHRVIFFDIENDHRDILKRLVLVGISAIAEPGVLMPVTETDLIEKGIPKTAEERLFRCLKNISVFSVGDDKVTPKTMESWYRLAAEEIGRDVEPLGKGHGKQAIIFVDSINELASAYPLAGGTYESLERWLAEIKRLRVKYQIPTCLICHVPKDSPKEIFNPKGSSGIAHFARTQAIVKKEKIDGIHDKLTIKVVRSQFGPGRTGGIKMVFNRTNLSIGPRGGDNG